MYMLTYKLTEVDGTNVRLFNTEQDCLNFIETSESSFFVWDIYEIADIIDEIGEYNYMLRQSSINKQS